MHIILTLLIASIIGTNGYRQLCEQQDFNHSQAIWIRRFELGGGAGLLTKKALLKPIYQSPAPLVHHKPSGVAEAFGTEAILTHVVAIYGTEQLMPFRISSIPIWFHFYHGDMAQIHILNPATGEYKKIELGAHTLQYFTMVPAGAYYAVDIERHTKDKYVLMAFTLFNPMPKQSTSVFGDWNGLLEKFSAHSSIINTLFKRYVDLNNQ